MLITILAEASKSFLPITSIVLETGTFDPHALKNPEVLKKKWLYQKGINYGYANTKAYVLTRDGYACQHCKGKTKDQQLEVHHLVFRSQHGSDEEANLLTLCKTCHESFHAGTITLKRTGKKKGNLLHATQMNSIRVQLLKRVEAEETWGCVTKEHRLLAGLPKEHIFDAALIATRGTLPVFQAQKVLLKKCVSDGGYQSKTHARFLILDHLIFVRKYRKKLLVFYGDEVKRLFEEIATRSDFAFEALEVDQDHIHCLVKSEPRMSPLAIVRRLKQESTVQLWQRHEKALKKLFWKENTLAREVKICRRTSLPGNRRQMKCGRQS